MTDIPDKADNLREGELRRQVHNRVAKAANPTQATTVDGATYGIMKLVQAREQQAYERGRINEAKTCEEAKRHDRNELLVEILGEKKRYITELAWKHAASEEAVPVAVIKQRMVGNDGDSK